jgi:hypothetical protein
VASHTGDVVMSVSYSRSHECYLLAAILSQPVNVKSCILIPTLSLQS